MTPPPDDRFADLLARLPDGGAVVVVTVGPGDEAGASAERAIGVAEALAASRPHVLLAGIGGCGVVLDRVRGASGPGLEAVFAGESTLARVAVPAARRGPVYLPSGILEAGRAPDRDGAARRARRLAAVLRRSGATLVLLVESDVAAAAGLEASGAVRVLTATGEEAARARAGGDAPAGHGKAPSEPEVTTGESSGAASREGVRRKRGRWRRHRNRGQTGVAQAVTAVTLVAAAVGGWWITMAVFGPGEPATPELAPPPAGARATKAASGPSSGPGSGGGGTAPAQVATREPDARSKPGGEHTGGASRREEKSRKGAPTPAGRSTRDGRAAPAGATATSATEVAADAPTLPYSVLIASYSTRTDAARRARRWSADDDILYLVAPTPVQGRVYYRLFAGAVSSRREAAGLMDRLVQRGRKESSNAWDVRPVSLAFRMGLRSTRRSAAARADSLVSRGLPAYVIPAASAGDTVWQVYAGAFESRDAAAALARALQEAGEDGKLVTRRGTMGR